TTPSPKPVPGGVPPTGPSNVRRASAARLSGRTVSPRVAFPTTTWSERRTPMRRALFHSFVALVIAIGAAACANTARGVAEDTQENASGVRGGIETADVKSALLADGQIDAGAIDVDTYQDKRVVVLRGSVPTEAQKKRAQEIAER